ncbi:MAG: clostripain-related cysteine peptidase [Mucilaginibacter sp.]|uniref:clostripain-related cysteine peptidase n=1 Tax=Mucilaginibacter sp. TaxID=1882438 RepID=UPI003266DF69
MLKKRNVFPFIVILISIFCLQNCKKHSEIFREKSVDSVNRMVLVYIAGNNNLQYDAINSINKLEMGLNNANATLLVFVKTTSAHSYLLKIKHDNTDKIISDTIKTYGSRNSSDPDFLKEIINDSRSLSPAKSYGLVLWSHATSWAPSELKVNAFGNDNGKEMDIKDLRNAIPSDFAYIMFDACYMGALEVVYELKGKTKYILASPSEVLSTSFPYELITPYLFGGQEDLKIIAQKYFEYYQSKSGYNASATIALIDTEQLEQLALYTSSLLSSNQIINKNFNISLIQRMDFDASSQIKAYDFLSFLKENFKPEQYSNITDQLNKVILYSNHTNKFLNNPINDFCGLSIYLPIKNDPFITFYSTLNWYSSSGWFNLFQ